MNLQSIPVEKTGRTTPSATPLVRQLAGDAFDVRKFAENFDVLVNVAGSTKHLKELVLKLAASGGLSSDSTDTAESLLAELQRQRLRLGKAGVRIGDPSPPVTEDEAPYAIPSGWRWIRLRDLGGVLGGGTPSKSNASFWEGPLPWVSPKDMKRPHIDDAEDHISTAAVEGSAVKLIPAQSILYVVRGMILAHSFPVAIATREVTINQDMKALVLAIPALSAFILRCCQAARTRVLAKVERSSHGTCRLESEAVEMLPIALPPLAEQKRIVARVDQLMALIDDLEAKQTNKRGLSTRFTKASLEALTTAESPEAFDTAWQRVVENFSSVVESVEKVAEMRAAILGLAMRGRLVTHQVGTSASSEMRGHKPDAQPVGASEGPHGLPGHWAWYRLRDVLGSLTDGDHQAPPQVPVGVPFLTIGNVSKGALEFDGARAVPRSYFEALDARRVPRRGDILYTVVGATYGRPIPVDLAREFCVQRHIAILRPDGTVDRDYLYLYLRSRIAYDQATNATTGTAQPTVPLKPLREFKVPVPPLAEQKRIVAKVEHLMKLCDDLEAKLRRAEDRASKLVEAVVQEMVA